MNKDMQAENFSAFLDGNLSDAEARAFLAEVARDPAAAAELRRLVRLRELIADAFNPQEALPVPPAVQERWQTAVRSAAAARAPVPLPARPVTPPAAATPIATVLRPRQSIWRALIPAAAVVLLAAGVLVYAQRLRQNRSDNTPSLAAGLPATPASQLALKQEPPPPPTQPAPQLSAGAMLPPPAATETNLPPAANAANAPAASKAVLDRQASANANANAPAPAPEPAVAATLADSATANATPPAAAQPSKTQMAMVVRSQQVQAGTAARTPAAPPASPPAGPQMAAAGSAPMPASATATAPANVPAPPSVGLVASAETPHARPQPDFAAAGATANATISAPAANAPAAPAAPAATASATPAASAATVRAMVVPPNPLVSPEQTADAGNTRLGGGARLEAGQEADAGTPKPPAAPAPTPTPEPLPTPTPAPQATPPVPSGPSVHPNPPAQMAVRPTPNTQTAEAAGSQPAAPSAADSALQKNHNLPNVHGIPKGPQSDNGGPDAAGGAPLAMTRPARAAGAAGAAAGEPVAPLIQTPLEPPQPISIPYNAQNLMLVEHWVKQHGGSIQVTAQAAIGTPVGGRPFLGFVDAIPPDHAPPPLVDITLVPAQLPNLKAYVSGMQAAKPAVAIAQNEPPETGAQPAHVELRIKLSQK
ncbi:MAG: hypothetical protein ACREJ2_18580 [Planctomycetota bacterium]